MTAGGDPSSFDAPLIATVLRGAARVSTHVPAPAAPLPRRELIRVCRALKSMGPDGGVAAAAVLFGVTTFLRQSNFLPKASPHWSPHLLRRDNVELKDGHLLVTVGSTKTRLPSHRPITLVIAPAPTSDICPVATCLTAWRAVPAPGCAPLFLLPSSGLPLTAPGLVALLRSVLRALHHPSPQDVTLHSLRRTGALLAVAGGSLDEEVMAHGTWTSSAYRAYVPRPTSSTVPAAIAAAWH